MPSWTQKDERQYEHVRDSEIDRGSTLWIVLPLKIDAGTQDLRERLVLS